DHFKDLEVESQSSSIIKTSRNLRRKAHRRDLERLTDFQFVNFRPFHTKHFFLSSVFVDELGGMRRYFSGANRCIGFLSVSSSHELACLGSSLPVDYGMLKQGN